MSIRTISGCSRGISLKASSALRCLPVTSIPLLFDNAHATNSTKRASSSTIDTLIIPAPPSWLLTLKQESETSARCRHSPPSPDKRQLLFPHPLHHNHNPNHQFR